MSLAVETSTISAPSHALQRAPRNCAHCGQRVPIEDLSLADEEAFCCSGCRAAFHLLKGAGLDEYYSFRNDLGELGERVGDIEGGIDAEFDTESFHERYVETLPSGLKRAELLLAGVHCAACVWLVERLSRLEPSVCEARLDLASTTVTVTWNAAQAPLSQVARTLAQMGYRSRPFRGQEAARLRRDEMRALLIRIGVAGAAAGNVMLMAFALYSGGAGFETSGSMSGETRRFLEGLSFLISLPALWAGSVFFRGAWFALRTRTPHMDLPIALGIFTGFAWGALGVVSGRGEIYFDSITALIFFLLVGRYLQRRHQMAAADAAELLQSVLPGRARVVDSSGAARLVALGQVLRGQWVVVEPGEVVPVDGIVQSGCSSLDKSLMTGESRPVAASSGDVIEAGALNLNSVLRIEATGEGAESRVARLMREVERARSTKTPLVGQADRFAGRFTVLVILAALAVALIWSFQSANAAVEHAVALLIVACPCALGLATPLALSAAISRAARQRIIVFSPEALEQLARPVELIFDKTGTLTEGKMTIVRWEGDDSLLGSVWALEKHSRHPVARALRQHAESQGAVEAQLLSKVEEKLGAGVKGATVAGTMTIGAPRFVLASACIAPELEQQLHRSEEDGTPVLVACDSEVRAIAWLGDKLRPDAALALRELKAQGHRIHLLSGDHHGIVEKVARELANIVGETQLFSSVQGEVSPEKKWAEVNRLQGLGKAVVMVGDGVNDAAALAEADVGVAVTGAAEASRLSSDIFLATPGVGQVAELFRGSKRVLATIRRGIVFSLFYNAIGIAGAAFGLVSPLAAAILMPLSSLTVVSNAYRSRTFQREVDG